MATKLSAKQKRNAAIRKYAAAAKVLKLATDEVNRCVRQLHYALQDQKKAHKECTAVGLAALRVI